jgi:hypothetical protein
MSDWLQPTLAIIGALGGVAGLAALFRIRAQNKADESKAKVDDASAADAIKRAALDLLKPYQEEQALMRKRIDELEAEINDVRGWAERLANQVRELGGEPVPFRSTRAQKKD